MCNYSFTKKKLIHLIFDEVKNQKEKEKKSIMACDLNDVVYVQNVYRYKNKKKL